ncbi:hypothetical protein KBC54_02060 [Patescibacteria group bacterium]|nr:hypothetical protein [Patescibacteria group bacterium]
METDKLRLEKFVGFGAKMSRKISVTKNYSFGLPPTFFAENGLESFNFVEIYFDSEAKALALHFLTEKSDACFKLIKYGVGEKRGGSFVAKSFFTRFDLDPNKVSGKYEPTKTSRDGIGDLFIIQLKEHPVSEPVQSQQEQLTNQ